MEVFNISGCASEPKLVGELAVSGAKNASLQSLAAVLLFGDRVSYQNIPNISDVNKMVELLREIGVVVRSPSSNAYTAEIHDEELDVSLPEDIMGQFRASVILTGPLLARKKRVSFGHPGGCLIGARPIDLFIEGFQKLGAVISEDTEKNSYVFDAPNGLQGAEIFLRSPSVTTTQTLMMAGVLAKGITIIKNSALEPETFHLAEFLNKCGAKISGAGTHTITVEGTGLLRAQGRVYTSPPDRIEAGSYLILGALLAREVSIINCEPAHLEAALELVQYSTSAKIHTSHNSITIANNKKPEIRAVDVKTNEYPGFPTDLQAPFTVLLTQARGTSLVFETIFEGRLEYVPALCAMGANIKLMDAHRILVNGPSTLTGKTIKSTDIRAGLAYVIAALIAKGRSVIHNVSVIDRGYEKIDKRLTGIGAQISRLEQ